jgi:hypothetical protein
VTTGGFDALSPTQTGAELRLLVSADVDQVAGLVFELATQLHVERQRRLALEEILTRRHVVGRDELAALTSDEGFAAIVAAELDAAQQGLLDVLLENDDARAPLRRQAIDEEGR